jgi:hypothetical protein
VLGWLRTQLQPSSKEALRLRDEAFEEARRLSLAELAAVATSAGAYPLPSLRRERRLERWRFIAGGTIWRDKAGGLQLAVEVQAHGGFLGKYWSYCPRILEFAPSGASRELPQEEVIARGLFD